MNLKPVENAMDSSDNKPLSLLAAVRDTRKEIITNVFEMTPLVFTTGERFPFASFHCCAYSNSG